MKKILFPLMAAALVTGLSMGKVARAEEGAEAQHEEAAKPAKKGKGKGKMMKGKAHAKGKAKKDSGCGKDGNGCHGEDHEGGEGGGDAKKE